MIRITHIIGGLDQGGAEAMLLRLLRGLDRQSFSQSVVSLTTRGVHGDQVEAAGVPLHTLGMTGFLAAPRGLLMLRRLIKEQKPDIVQTWLYHADLLGLIAARTAGDATLVWNVRCSDLMPGDVPRSTRWLTRVLARLSDRPDAVLFNSTAGREAHRYIGYEPRRIEVIPNGFDLDERRPDPLKRQDFRREIGVDDGTFVIGMISRFHRMKDQTTFLAAAARLKGMNRPVSFVLAGLNHDWNNQALVAEIDQYGLRNRIVLLGARKDISRVMAGLDCLVSTSVSEGFPNVIGEAMACGVPCVATDAGDSRLIVGDTGTIVPIGDVAGVVAGVSDLIDASADDRRARSERCRRRIVEHFELSQVAARYAEFYQELNDMRLGVPAPASRPVREPPRTPGPVRAVAPALSADRQRRRRAARLWRLAILALVGAYVLLFYTPAAWLAGSYLTIREAPTRADAIVVFSGNGESTYINDGYQRRARDAAQYYKAGYAPLVVLSSGIQQTFDEVEIIKALLLSQGVPASAMHIIPKYPATTYENVQIVNEFLRQRNARSILFITAPYHSRRASMVWEKVAPDVKVITVPVVDTPRQTPEWRATVDQMNVISYEYLAIAYNRWKGWL